MSKIWAYSGYGPKQSTMEQYDPCYRHHVVGKGLVVV